MKWWGCSTVTSSVMQYCLPLASAGWVWSTIKFFALSYLYLSCAQLSIYLVTSRIFLTKKNLCSIALNPEQLDPQARMLTTMICFPLPRPYDSLWSYLSEQASADPQNRPRMKEMNEEEQEPTPEQNRSKISLNSATKGRFDCREQVSKMDLLFVQSLPSASSPPGGKIRIWRDRSALQSFIQIGHLEI